MKIALCCDHGGLTLKNAVMKYLADSGYETVDFGTTSYDSCDYPDFALKAAEAVASGQCERGIFVCTTGIGISIVANKVKGVRCALCTDTLCARMTREHNDANVLALGGGIVGVNLALDIVNTFLTTPFSNEEKHRRRIAKISAIEEKYGK
ncbi:MAG: ribose 5-phosphate isomerase B [Clostridiales bacterium]|nr:ribose 5-phosphate isomerase B [Clostridiales bacterium]